MSWKQHHNPVSAATLLATSLLMMVCCAFAANYCGDGIPDYSREQCDSGMRCVTQNNTLPWIGVGTSPGSKYVSISFRYAVQEFTTSGAQMNTYGVQVRYGSNTQAPAPWAYKLVCTDNADSISGQMQLLFAPETIDYNLNMLAGFIQWTYTGMTCTTFMTLHPSNLTSLLVLNEFSFRWIGSVASDVWLLDEPSSPAPSLTISPNSVCGTECCSETCNRTWATVWYDPCPLGALSMGTGAPEFFCQGPGTCTPDAPPTFATSSGCGNGIVEPGEQCDSGLYTVSMNAPSFIGGWICLGTLQLAFEFKFPINQLSSFITGPVINASLSTLPITDTWTGPIGSYHWDCTDIGNQIRFQMYDNQLIGPAITSTWEYSKPSGDPMCQNVTINPFGNNLLFISQITTYVDSTGWSCMLGQFSFNDRLIPATIGDDCCTATCQLPIPAFVPPCYPETPAVVPAVGPYYCQTDGLCSLTSSTTQTPSPLPTALPSAPPTISASPIPTSSPSISLSATSSITGSPGLFSLINICLFFSFCSWRARNSLLIKPLLLRRPHRWVPLLPQHHPQEQLEARRPPRVLLLPQHHLQHQPEPRRPRLVPRLRPLQLRQSHPARVPERVPVRLLVRRRQVPPCHRHPPPRISMPEWSMDYWEHRSEWA